MKPQLEPELEKGAVAGEEKKNEEIVVRYTPALTTSNVYSNTSKLLSREKPKYHSNLGLSNIHKITPQYSRQKPEVTYGTGETPTKLVSFFEKVLRGEHRNKPDSKEFMNFVSSSREQMSIAKKIMPHASKYYLEKSVRLKRDFKSRQR